MTTRAWSAIPASWEPKGGRGYCAKLPKAEDITHPSSLGNFLKEKFSMTRNTLYRWG